MGKTEELMEMLCTELDELAEKGNLTVSDLDMVYKLIVSKEKLLRIEELEGNLGYSGAGEWQAGGTYNRSRGYSRSRSGQHYVRGHYSYDDGRNDMIYRMEDMMNNQNLSASDRSTLRKAMDMMR